MEQKNQFSTVRITRENGAAFYSYVLDGHIEWVLEHGVLGIGLLEREGRACGAAILRPLQKNTASGLEIVSFFIDEQIRGQGAGKYLLKAAQFLCTKSGHPLLCAVYPYPKLYDLESLLAGEGFEVAQENGRIYRISVAEAVKSSFSGMAGPHVKRVCDLQEQQRTDWMAGFGRRFPRSLAPQRMDGEFLPEISTVYLEEGCQVTAFVLCSRLPDGSLYIGAMYAQPDGGNLLAQAFSGALEAAGSVYPDGTLCLAVSGETGGQLAKQISVQCEKSLELQTIRTSVWRIQKTFENRKDNDMMKPEPEETNMTFTIGYEALMPRLNALSNTLFQIGRENDVLFRTDALPCILCQTQEGQFQFTYIPAKGLGGESYFLNITAEFSLPENSDGGLLCFRFNAASRVAQASYDSINEKIVLRAVLPEAEQIVSGETLRFFTDAFEQDAKTVQEALQS